MLWIVFGYILAGGVHDCGMLSVRNGGASMPFLSRKYLGKPIKYFVNLLAIVLLVGVVFVASPAQLMSTITMDLFGGGAILVDNAEAVGIAATSSALTVWGISKETVMVWIAIIFICYIVATLFPIDKIIDKIYPFFGVLLLFMSAGMVYGLLKTHFSADPISFMRSVGGFERVSFAHNFQPKADVPLWFLLFLTISYGALPGFYATQMPLMARCAMNEREGRFIFMVR